MSSKGEKGRYMAGLDGLRALAVFAVIAYHLNLGIAPGGLLGVGVFFVLSGYLITDILAAQGESRGRLDLKDFWLRRARRLLPGVLFLLVAVTAWVMMARREQAAALFGDVWAAVLYVSNWRLIFHHVSYFESFGPPSPFGHLWSLAVEEQFYLLWPLLLGLGLRFVRKRGWLAGLILAAAAGSAALMAALYQPGLDPSRVYYGTDTRAFALLIGAALAILWPSRKLQQAVSKKARFALDLVGGAGLLGVLAMIWRSNQYDAFLYRGGLVLVSVATAAIIASLAHPASRLGRWMGWGPLRWLGVRSYGIYLWHYPVIVLSSPAVNTGGIDWTRAVLQVAGTLVLAALSYRFVEEPIRYGIKTRGGRWRLRIASACAAVACGVIVAALVVGMPAAVTAQVPGDVAPEPAPAAPAGPVLGPPLPPPAPEEPAPETPAPETPVPQTPTPTQPEPPAPPPQEKPAEPEKPVTPQPGQGITAVGDSVMLDAKPYLEKRFPGIVVDGKIGRQMYELPDVIAELKANGQFGDRIIIETGTNGPFTTEQMVALLQSLGSRKQILLVNTRVPRPWESVVNATLKEAAAKVPGTTLIDWYGTSAGHDGYFEPDGVHLNPEGSQAYAALLAKNVRVEPQ